MDEIDCRLLLSLYKTRSITQTAEELYISQPAVTKRIQNMEKELDCMLILRTKKGIAFTPAGEAAIPDATDILVRHRIIRDKAAASKTVISGSLHIGASNKMAHHRLPKILSSFMAEYPKVDVHIITGTSPILFKELQRDEVAIAIISGEYDWDGETELICSDPMCLVCSSKDTGKLLSEYDYIDRLTDEPLKLEMNHWRELHGLAGTPPKFYISDVDTCKAMVSAGLGWCILPKMCLDDFDGHIEELTKEDGSPMLRNTYVFYRSAYAGLPQVRLFLKHLRAGMNQQ